MNTGNNSGATAATATTLDSSGSSGILAVEHNFWLSAMANNGSALPSDSWIVDSGATIHIAKHRHWFKTFSPGSSTVIYSSEASTSIPVLGTGSIDIIWSFNGRTTRFTLLNVAYAPDASNNMISLGILDERNIISRISNGSITFSFNNIEFGYAK